MTTDKAENAIAEIRNQVHSKCIVCGFKNDQGLHLEFCVADDGSVEGGFVCDESCAGYAGITHGGIISLILDGAMGNCMFARGQATVTVELTTKFRHPVVTGQEATVCARITRVSHPLYLLEAEIIQDRKVKATAQGKYYDQPKLIGSDEVVF